MNMEFVLAALPILAFVACPLMMLACAVGIRGMARSSGCADAVPSPAATREKRIAALEAQLRTIQAELAAFQETEDAPGANPAAARPSNAVPGGTSAARRPA